MAGGTEHTYHPSQPFSIETEKRELAAAGSMALNHAHSHLEGGGVNSASDRLAAEQNVESAEQPFQLFGKAIALPFPTA